MLAGPTGKWISGNAHQLPTGPGWTYETIDIVGDLIDDETKEPMVETVELWKRDPVECIRELIGNPLFKESLHYEPLRLYCDEEGENRIYENMWTANWWWDTQVKQSTHRLDFFPVYLPL